MSRIPGAFRRIAKAGEAALVTYFAAGVPSPGVTRQLLPVIGRQGADVIVLGPYAGDPISNDAATSPSAATAIEECLAIAAEARRSNEVPLILLIHRVDAHAYGIERLAADCALAGTDALFVPDLPLDSARPFVEACRTAGIDLVLAVAATYDGDLLSTLATETGGLVFVAADGPVGLGLLVEDVRRLSGLPVVVQSAEGTPEEVGALAGLADGVLVAGPLGRVMASAHDDLMLDVSEVVRTLKEATHKGEPSR
jgi:tryptophan synthase alpha subunit